MGDCFLVKVIVQEICFLAGIGDVASDSGVSGLF